MHPCHHDSRQTGCSSTSPPRSLPSSRGLCRGGGGKPSFPSPSAGDLRELPRVSPNHCVAREFPAFSLFIGRVRPSLQALKFHRGQGSQNIWNYPPRCLNPKCQSLKLSQLGLYPGIRKLSQLSIQISLKLKAILLLNFGLQLFLLSHCRK